MSVRVSTESAVVMWLIFQMPARKYRAIEKEEKRMSAKKALG